MKSIRWLTSRTILATAAFAAGATLPVEAQLNGSIDAGSGTMRMDSESPSAIFRLAPALQLITPVFRFNAEGDYAGHPERGWQTQGRLSGAARKTLFGSLEAQAVVRGGWSRTTRGRAAAGWIGEGRIQVGDNLRGFALAAGSGQAITGNGTQPMTSFEAGGWGRLGRLDLGFRLRRTGLTAPGHVGNDGVVPRDTLDLSSGSGRSLEDHYTDTEATIGWSKGNFSLEGGVGRRFGKRAVRFTSWHVRGLYQLNSRVSLVATTGEFPIDVISGLPSGSFTTFSMRFNLRPDLRRSPSEILAQRGGHQFEAVPAGVLYVISVVVPRANTVEMMGSFTNWEPVLLVPDEGDVWRLRMPLKPGLHEANIRVDAGEWTVPAGLTSVDDGLGGRVGVFIIE